MPSSFPQLPPLPSPPRLVRGDPFPVLPWIAGSIGRYTLVVLLRDPDDAVGRAVLAAITAARELLAGRAIDVYCVASRLEDRTPRVGVTILPDPEGRIHRAVGLSSDGEDRCSLLLDPGQRVIQHFEIGEPAPDIAGILAVVRQLPPPQDFPLASLPAPVLLVPHLLEPELIRSLLERLDAAGPERELVLEDEPVRAILRERVGRRLMPRVLKAFQCAPARFDICRLVCYPAGRGEGPDRRIGSIPSPPRRFAVVAVLNAGAFEGGSMYFPEFGPRTYDVPPGGALVFSCSLVCAMQPVTAGRRLTLETFLFGPDPAPANPGAGT